MGQQLTPLRLEQLDGKWWAVMQEFRYRLDSGEIITAPAGFRTDLQSIPPPLWSVFGHPADAYAASGVDHDLLYRYPSSDLPEGAKPRSRRRCDQIYLEINRDLGCPWWKRTGKYAGVRIGGWRAWNRYRKAEQGEG